MTRETRQRWHRRRFLSLAGTASGLALVGYAVGLVASPDDPATDPPGEAFNLLDQLPAQLRSAVRRGTVSTDLEQYFDLAAARAVTLRRALFVPRGTYTMRTWSPPANLVVLTDGRDTVFKQLDTQGKPQRFIEVAVDGVRLWPGGAATIDGGMTPRGINATQFNSGIRVHAASGVHIREFVCGDVYGRNIGGDVVEIGCARDGVLDRCRIGTIYGDNVYRNVLSVTGGREGNVVAVIQTGGCGLMTVDFEPDPSSARLERWRVGTIRGHRVSVVGDAHAGAGAVTLDDVVMDYRAPVSIPAFDTAGVSARASPGLFKVGFRFRNAQSIDVVRAVITGFPRGAIEDIGSQAGDSPCEQVRFRQLEIRDCGGETGYQVTAQKTRLLMIDALTAVDKPLPSVATFISGDHGGRIEVGGGRGWGRMLHSAGGDLALRNVSIDGAGESVFRGGRRAVSLDGVSCTNAAAVFENCSGDIVVQNSRLDGRRIMNGSRRARYLRSTVNGVFYDDRRTTGDSG